MDLTGIGSEGVDWISLSLSLSQDLDQWRSIVNTVMNLRVLYKALNLLTT
jgi:hypothetical protein